MNGSAGTGPQRASGNLGEEATNLGIILLIAAAVTAVVLHGAGFIAAWLTGASQPAGGIQTGLLVLAHPSNPGGALDAAGLNPVVYWSIVAVLLGVVTVAGLWVLRTVREYGRRVKTDPSRIVGVATRPDVDATASEKALLARAANLRPSLAQPRPADVGYRIGLSCGRSVWASVEDSILLIGPPRSGRARMWSSTRSLTPPARS